MSNNIHYRGVRIKLHALESDDGLEYGYSITKKGIVLYSCYEFDYLKQALYHAKRFINQHKNPNHLQYEIWSKSL